MRITIGKKMYVSFSLILLLLLLVGSSSYFTMRAINDKTAVERENIQMRHFFAEKVTDHLAWVMAMYDQIYLGKEFKKQLDPTKCDFGKWYYSFEARDPEIKKIFDSLEEPHKDLHGSANLILAQLKAGNKTEAEKIFREKTNGYLEVLQSKLKEMGDLMAAREEKARQEAAAQQRKGAILILVSIAIAISVGFALSFYLTRSITRPVNALSGYLNQAAEGDLTIDNINVSTQDEIGVMAAAFNKMVENLKDMISQINTTSATVASTSEQLAANANQASLATQQVAAAVGEVAKGNNEQTTNVNQTVETTNQLILAIEQIAKGAQEQSQNVMQTADIVNQMAAAIQDVAANSQAVSTAAVQTAEVAEKGGEAVKKSVDGMERIRQSVFDTANKIKELGEHSQQIGEIIQVIDDIAEQTNLLALNAAIEAARAGEHGKGFAVVADEVRKLAERSSKATKEIAGLITNIQRGTENAVKAMEVGTGEVEAGAQLAHNAGLALDEIVQQVKRSVEQVESISAASEEMAASSAEVIRAIDNVSAITEENTAATEQMTASSSQVMNAMQNIAAISEESGAAAEEVSASIEETTASVEEIATSAKALAETADELKEIVGRFLLKKIEANCWDIMDCPDDRKAKCPAYNAKEKRCWLIGGTWCGGVQQGDAKSKRHRCMNCKAFKFMTRG